MCKKALSKQFKFICLTDRDESSDKPIEFIRVDGYELDTWWNKVLIFKDGVSGESINLYFDLDVSIVRMIDSLIDDIEHDKLCVVDTVWKDREWNDEIIMDRKDAFISYGNSSVMGWIGRSHDFLTQMLLEDVYKHTSEHYGDDTFIQKYGRIKYFKRAICKEDPLPLIGNPAIWTHVKGLLTDPSFK